MIGSLVTWLISYAIVFILITSHSIMWVCQLISTVYSTVSIIQSIVSAAVTDPWPFSSIYTGEENASLHNSMMANTLGFLLCETFLFMWLWYRSGKPSTAFILPHKIAVGIISITSLYQNQYGAAVVLIVGLSDVTTMLLNLSWLIRSVHYNNNLMSLVVDCVNISYFFVTRVIIFFMYGTSLVHLNLFYLTYCVVFLLVDFLFFIQMSLYTYKLY